MRSPGPKQVGRLRQRDQARNLLLLSAWCGLAAGLLELGARVFCRAVDPSQRLYSISHHFIWLGPLSNLTFFLGLGLLLAGAVTVAPRAAGWFGPRLICACALLPALMAAWPGIYTSAWLLVALGAAVSLVPTIERHGSALRKGMPWSFALMMGLVLTLAGFDIDDQLGLLFDELDRRGVLDQTLIIVTSDHGEGLGEHNLFDHGESLYRTEIQVPLVIVPPAGLHPPAVVDETVSLRDLPATIVDLAGQEQGPSFPGESLARFWRETAPTGARPPRDPTPVISELTAPNPLRPNQGRSPGSRGPLISLAEGSFVYVRNDGDGSEQLFNERDDPREIDDRAHLESMRPVLEKLRGRLDVFRKNQATTQKK